MNTFSRVVGCPLATAVFLCAATSFVAADDDNASTAAGAAQMLALANQALSAGPLSEPDRARNLVSRGLAHEILGERSDALTDFDKAISARALNASEQAAALYDRGVTLDELGRTDDAVADYTAALQLQPNFAAALNNRGNAYRRLGRLSEARADYEASMRFGNPHPEYPDYGMGQIAEALGQPSAAIEYYRSALAANPKFALAEDRLVAMDAGAASATGEVATDPAHRLGHRRKKAHAAVRTNVDAGPLLKPTITDVSIPEERSVQLGAYRSETEANDAWNRAQRSAGGLLAGRVPNIVAVDLPAKGRYYRLRVGRLGADEAYRLCASLRAKGEGCILPSD
jgi:tetratricopeptide (TPR) repeat protein